MTKSKVVLKSAETELLGVDLPSNSNKSKDKQTRPEVQKITKGKVVKKKKSLGTRFKDTFFGEEVDSVSDYIVHDVLVPAIKNLIYDTVTGGLDLKLFGQMRTGSRTVRNKGKSYVSYNNMYSSRDRQPARTAVNRVTHNFDDIILETRGDAEEVLSMLVDLIEDYGMASVADLYDSVGVTSNFTDRKYGWTNLASASVSRVRDGYLLSLPRTTLLE